MPTENRSSNTEMVSVPRELAERIQLRLDHAASAFKVAKPERDQFRTLLAKPAPQPHAEPIAWMVGTAIWWTKEEAERDSAATGLPIVGLGPMIDPAVAERLSKATAFVQRMVECAGAQQSVATGYVRDILDVLKGSAAPSAPVELQRMSFEYVHADGERRTVALSREEVAGYMDEFLFEKLTEEICQCEPIGETNVVDCRCDEVAVQFSLVTPT
ncbi:hypothetical protein [Pseudomonas sp. CM27]|uniref:hypothetical protein n=1 Tax=Pseudomonas sp. CM27 TaxID=2738452 RepID=UPI001556DB3C|nr:hypothetical protein [Pseudomonas sp. CM27]NQD72952.1 hypothetical protein [Pseudomonas sp. CM27]